jgi:hypothetical protein
MRDACEVIDVARRMVMAMARLRGPKSVQVSLNLPVLQISGTWEPNDDERKAAWELYVELVTRISVVPLGPDEGLLREALSSLYSLFATTRDILRRYGPGVAEPKPGGQYSFGTLAVAMLNIGLRPCWPAGIPPWRTGRPGAPSGCPAAITSARGTRQATCAPRWRPPATC